MTDLKSKADMDPQRLCSEIQLFDLCDLDSCNYKNGRFCTDPLLLDRFEKIAEAELRAPELYISEGIDNAEMDDVEDDVDMDNYDNDEDDCFEDEE